MDFWLELGPAYRVFGSLCDYQDWVRILTAIGAKLAGGQRPDFPYELLDVGSGSGCNTLRVAELLQNEIHRRPCLTAIEPSPHILPQLEKELVPATAGGMRDRICDSLTDLDQGASFDGIAFIHSSYYIPDFADALQAVVNGFLARSGVAVVVAMSSHSPFFLGRHPTLPNTAEQVVSDAEDRGLRVDSHRLNSRFRFPTESVLNGRLLSALHRFVGHGGDFTTDQFRSLFTAHMIDGAGVDMLDHLIVIRP